MSADATSTRRGVSAAEKYAELAALGQERPVCVCHGEPQIWHKGSRRAGGQWKCAARHREHGASYRAANAEKIQDHNARRVILGNTYVGRAATLEEAAEVNQRLQEKLFDFKAKQQAKYREGIDGWINAPVA